MTIRKNVNSLTATERQNFVNAVLVLKNKGATGNLYDQFVTTHHTIMMGDFGQSTTLYAHRCASFLPWHRQFLLLFEQSLQAIDASVSLPYWNWAVDNSKTSAVWGNDLMGGDGTGQDNQVLTGPFAYSTGNWPISVGDTVPYLRRALGQGSPFLPSSANGKQALNSAAYDVAPYNNVVRSGFRGTLEGWAGPGNHNQVHTWVGGQMVLTHSPNDPVFWLHHCNIDRLWAQWQASHPTQSYLPDTATTGIVSLHDAMKPWDTNPVVTPADMLDHTSWYQYDTEIS